MAASGKDMKTQITELRQKILSYKPGKAVPCDDELRVFPDHLAIGVMNVYWSRYDIVHDLRHVLRGDIETMKFTDRRDTEDDEEYVTDYISVINTAYNYRGLRLSRGELEAEVEDLAPKVGCFVILIDRLGVTARTLALDTIKNVTGHYPIVGLYGYADKAESHRKWLNAEGITEIYVIPVHDGDQHLSDTVQLQLLKLLHACLSEGDRKLTNDSINAVLRDSRYKAKEDVKEAKQNMTKEIRQREQVEESLRNEMTKLKVQFEEISASRNHLADENAGLKNEIVSEREKREQVESAKQNMNKAIQELEQVEKSQRNEIKKLKMEFEEASASHERIAEDNARLKNEIIIEKGNREQVEFAMTKYEKIAQDLQDMLRQRETKFEEELKRREHYIKEHEEHYKELENNHNGLIRENDQLKGEIMRAKEKQKQIEDEIKEGKRVEKEKSSVESALRNELKSEKERVEQLERETWKLRTKIQLESEQRSAEQRMKADTPQWLKGFLHWNSSVKQTQYDPSLSSNPSGGGSGNRDVVEAGTEDADDEFTDILKNIADDLYDESKIDSLGSQLGIFHGDIQRALQTNMRFSHVTSDGTRHMLHQWREGVSRKDERYELRRALEAAKLIDIADRYLPQEGPARSNQSRIDEGIHRPPVDNCSISEQGFTEKSSDLREDESEVKEPGQLKHLEDSRGESEEDDPLLAQGSNQRVSEVKETMATTDHASADNASSGNMETNEDMCQQSEESPVQVTTGEMYIEETNTLDEGGVLDDVTTKMDALVSNLDVSNAYAEKLYVLFFAKVLIDIRKKVFII